MSDQVSRRSFVTATAMGVASAAAAASAARAASSVEAASTRPSGTPQKDALGPTVFQYGYDKEPYPLDPGPHLFLDWRYVLPGRTSYTSPAGKGTNSSAEGLHGKVTTDQILVQGKQTPYGIRIEAQKPTKLGPVVPNDKPWEWSQCYPTLGYFDGKYRMWYEVITPFPHGAKDVLCYAESSDGVTWEKPELGLCEFDGSKKNNIVFDEATAGHGFHGIGVFRDPSAPAEQRYKMVYNSSVPPETVARLKARSPGSVTSLGESKHLVIYCAASPDGIRWKPLPQPLMSHMSDTGTTMYFDEVLNRYVSYLRTSFMNRRVIGRSEGPTLDAPWPAPESIVWTGPDELPSNDYYTNGKSLYPGTRTMHLLFPTIYQRFSDTAVVRMMTSLEGKYWACPPGASTVLEAGPEGTWDGGCVFAGNGMAEIAGDRVALPYVGYPIPHKFPRLVRCGAVGLAVWPKRRLSAVVADEEGEFFTTPLKAAAGDTLRLNFAVRRNGFIKVAALGADGRTVENCDPLFGDRLDATVTWKGNPSLSGRAASAEGVTLQFQMRSAKLFSFEFV